MTKLGMLSVVLTAVVHIGGMDAPPASCIRALDPSIFKRYNVAEWHAKLLIMVVYNKKDQLLHLLHSAGDDAKQLVSSYVSDRGTILDVAYLESTQEIKETILSYMDDESLIDCFNKIKSELYGMWHNVSQLELQKRFSDELIIRGKTSSIDLLNLPPLSLSLNPVAEGIMRDLYKKNSVRFPLTSYEREKLGIKNSPNN